MQYNHSCFFQLQVLICIKLVGLLRASDRPPTCTCQARTPLPFSIPSSLLLVLVSLPAPSPWALLLPPSRTHHGGASVHHRAADLGGQVEADVGAGHREVPVKGAVGGQAEGCGKGTGQGQGTPQGCEKRQRQVSRHLGPTPALACHSGLPRGGPASTIPCPIRRH